MFNNITALTTVALLCTATLAFLGLVQPRPSDKAHYEALIRSTVVQRPANLLEQRPTHQVRTGVQKDFWIQERHVRIKSTDSELLVQQRTDKFEITENLESLQCCMQNNIPNTLQEIRWLTAKQGVFSYPSNHFEAKDANLSIYSLEGTEFPESQPEARPNSSVAADSATWDWPNALHLNGHVRLFSTRMNEKPTFALADELFFHPSTGNIELRANMLNKVLLWQDEMRLSSPSIEIQRNSKTKTEQIKGIGDVHFYFTGEEEAMFYKIFGIKI